MNVLSRREEFLQRVGLEFDPFLTRNAEDELEPALKFGQRNQNNRELLDPIQTTLKFALRSYFFPPPITPTPTTQSVLNRFRQPEHTFLFAPRGAGKSSLRFLLEAQVRAHPRRTLGVAYKPDTKIRSLTALQHERALAQALATALLVQVIEQFNPIKTRLTQEQIFALGHQMIIAGPRAERLAQAILQDPQPNARTGLAGYFPLIGKFPVRYVPQTPELFKLLQQALEVKRDYVPVHRYENTFAEGLRSARLWGYENILVLVDGVEGHNRNPSTMCKLLAPLLQNLARYQSANVFWKFFLPEELEERMSQVCAFKSTLLYQDAIFSRIRWNTDSLIQLLDQRFQAAGAPYLSFFTISANEWDGELERRIAESAKGSPRRVVQIVNELIDAHIRLKTIPDKLTIDDWNYMQQRWKYGEPAPAAFET